MIKALSFKANTQPITDIKVNKPEANQEEKKSSAKNQKIYLLAALAVLAAGGIYIASRGKGANKLSDNTDDISKGLNQTEEKLIKKADDIVKEAGEVIPAPSKTEVFEEEKTIIEKAKTILESTETDGKPAEKKKFLFTLDDDEDVIGLTRIAEEPDKENSPVIDEITENMQKSAKNSSFRRRVIEKFAKFEENMTRKPKSNKGLTELAEEAGLSEKTKKSNNSIIKDRWNKFKNNLKKWFNDGDDNENFRPWPKL